MTVVVNLGQFVGIHTAGHGSYPIVISGRYNRSYRQRRDDGSRTCARDTAYRFNPFDEAHIHDRFYRAPVGVGDTAHILRARHGSLDISHIQTVLDGSVVRPHDTAHTAVGRIVGKHDIATVETVLNDTRLLDYIGNTACKTGRR